MAAPIVGACSGGGSSALLGVVARAAPVWARVPLSAAFREVRRP